MTPVRFHPEAEIEMISAAKFYETQHLLHSSFMTWPWFNTALP